MHRSIRIKNQIFNFLTHYEIFFAISNEEKISFKKIIVERISFDFNRHVEKNFVTLQLISNGGCRGQWLSNPKYR